MFPADAATTTRCLLVHFDEEAAGPCLPVLRQLRAAGIPSELYHTPDKLVKQFKYADQKGIPYMLLQGSEERAQGLFKLKNMSTGARRSCLPLDDGSSKPGAITSVALQTSAGTPDAHPALTQQSPPSMYAPRLPPPIST